jgi:hypothetical protein
LCKVAFTSTAATKTCGVPILWVGGTPERKTPLGIPASVRSRIENAVAANGLGSVEFVDL